VGWYLFSPVMMSLTSYCGDMNAQADKYHLPLNLQTIIGKTGDAHGLNTKTHLCLNQTAQDASILPP
jgi:hypothetical protein